MFGGRGCNHRIFIFKPKTICHNFNKAISVAAAHSHTVYVCKSVAVCILYKSIKSILNEMMRYGKDMEEEYAGKVDRNNFYIFM